MNSHGSLEMLKLLRTRGLSRLNRVMNHSDLWKYREMNLRGKVVPPSSSCPQLVWKALKHLMGMATYYKYGLCINLLALLNHVHIGF
jgi:hypothetical protein